jgi:hypothetical protein
MIGDMKRAFAEIIGLVLVVLAGNSSYKSKSFMRKGQPAVCNISILPGRYNSQAMERKVLWAK